MVTSGVKVQTRMRITVLPLTPLHVYGKDRDEVRFTEKPFGDALRNHQGPTKKHPASSTKATPSCLVGGREGKRELTARAPVELVSDMAERVRLFLRRSDKLEPIGLTRDPAG
jgi:hypothetical protein